MTENKLLDEMIHQAQLPNSSWIEKTLDLDHSYESAARSCTRISTTSFPTKVEIPLIGLTSNELQGVLQSEMVLYRNQKNP